MKKLLTLLFAVAMTLSLAGFAQAQDSGSAGSTTQTETKADKKAAKKAKKESKKAAKKAKKDSKKADSDMNK